MELKEKLQNEFLYLNTYGKRAIMISTTARHDIKFKILPRRTVDNYAISCFMINEHKVLEEVLTYFDGKVDYIYIDIERKQEINLFETAREIVNRSELLNVKPNDNTLESCDLLVRYQFCDDLYNQKVVVIGTGNLAGKIAIRLAERQAKVYILGRSLKKESNLAEAINLFLPKNSYPVNSFKDFPIGKEADVVASFLSGTFEDESRLQPVIGEDTFVIDGGINNFRKGFIHQMLAKGINLTRLDTRIALPYQTQFQHQYTQAFFKEVFGQGEIDSLPVASGGFIGTEGAIIVDNIKEPNQVVGIADGSGGVKRNEQLSKSDRNNIQRIQEAISASR